MTIWFTSDTHVSHRKICSFEPETRPFDDVHQMNDVLVARWNQRVMPMDTVYHLGDVAMGPVEEWDAVMSRLNGHKHLVIGNHDRVFSLNKEDYISRFMPVYEQWFATIQDEIVGFELSNGAVVNMSHFPYTGDHFDEDRFDDVRMVDGGTPLLHGHIHGQSVYSESASGTPQIHVGVDAWRLRPVSEAEVIHALDNKTVRIVD